MVREGCAQMYVCGIITMLKSTAHLGCSETHLPSVIAVEGISLRCGLNIEFMGNMREMHLMIVASTIQPRSEGSRVLRQRHASQLRIPELWIPFMQSLRLPYNT